MSPSSRLALALAIPLTPVVLHAQAVLETGTVDAVNRSREALAQRQKKQRGSEEIPMLHEGELEDSGPQLLLLEAPPHDWFQMLCDVQLYGTSNVAQVERNATAADVLVLTAQGAVNAKPASFAGGKLFPAAGFRYQNFRYGTLRGRDELVSNSYISLGEMDFEAFTPYAQIEWRAGPWSAGAGLRFAAYVSQETSHATYQEWAPALHAGRSFAVGKNGQVTLDADFTYRFSHSFLPPGFSLPPGWFFTDQNDRYDIGVNLAYTAFLGEKWLLQPAYRFQFSDYTHASSSRRDYSHILSLTVGYYFNENFSVRAFGTAEFRKSSDTVVADYKNYGGGVGLMGVVSF